MKAQRKLDIFLPHRSQYGVLQHFTKKMYGACQKKGFVCRLFEADDQATTIHDPPDVTLGFNGAPPHPSGILLCDLIERPHICCLVDMPYHYAFLAESQFIHMGCNDQFSERIFRENGFSRTFFLPVAADTEVITPVDQKRPFDIVMMATFIDYEGRRSRWKEQLPLAIVKVMNQAVEMIFAKESLAIAEAFQIAYNEAVLSNTEIFIDPAMMQSALAFLEFYIRGRDRAELIRSITHLPIHVFNGSVDPLNWSHFLKDKQTNLIFHPTLNFEESLKIFSQSKIILNSSPHTRHGASERIFNALAAGALPLTNANVYIASILDQGKDLLFFENKHLDRVEPLLQTFLNDETLRQSVARAGQQKVLEKHGWENRVDLLIDYLEGLKDIS